MDDSTHDDLINQIKVDQEHLIDTLDNIQDALVEFGTIQDCRRWAANLKEWREVSHRFVRRLHARPRSLR